MIFYKLKEIKLALKVLERFDFQFSKTSKITGIKVRTIRCWNNKQKEGLPLLMRPFIPTRKGKLSIRHMEYMFSLGNGINCFTAQPKRSNN